MPAEKKPSAARIRALDWHRGLAVLVMIECHCLVLLNPSHDNEPLRLFLNSINGLVAPSFIFAAGFALSMVSCRAASDPVGRRERAIKTLLRICEVLVVANILKVQMWPVFSKPSWWLRVDVLSCIAYSLFILWACVFSLGNRPRTIAAVMAGLSVLIFALAPWTETLRGLGPLQHFINNSTESPFPVLPWAGYAFLGASIGALMSIPGRGPALLLRALAAMFAVGLLIAYSGAMERLYRWNPWITVNAGERIWKVAAIALTLRGAELFGTSRGWSMKNPVTWVLELYGTSSLSAFYFHATLLFGFTAPLVLGGYISFHPVGEFHAKVGWGMYWLLTLLIVAGTGVCCRLWDFVDVRLPWKAAKKKPEAAPKAA
ncbi:MAG: DUF1624 domain-containing protein [Planctomycetia bacterium]|nr:DUF1624 domain-containing protein [Planctomycetia bacterium]